ncbi:type II toxin-antitoxin system RelE/ParE family toxin [Pinirhizobacter sp.]|uniref:type II toxin-antitoxin system RelE/ParE family toxin n=1 Tax=Pinirhizobacter sp. TaxID=2950432 RepID=UPI0039C96162
MSTWTVDLAKDASDDVNKITRWTFHQFGQLRSHAYTQALSQVLKDLVAGPLHPGVQRLDIGSGLFSIHMARHHRRARHMIIFRVASDENRSIEVLRILHDAMNIKNHLILS